MTNEHRLKMAANMAIRQRNYQRARQRAFTRLANAFPDIYKAYLEEEKQNDKAQGKAWIDLDGNTIGGQFPDSLNTPKEREPSDYYESEGN